MRSQRITGLRSDGGARDEVRSSPVLFLSCKEISPRNPSALLRITRRPVWTTRGKEKKKKKMLHRFFFLLFPFFLSSLFSSSSSYGAADGVPAVRATRRHRHAHLSDIETRTERRAERE